MTEDKRAKDIKELEDRLEKKISESYLHTYRIFKTLESLRFERKPFIQFVLDALKSENFYFRNDKGYAKTAGDFEVNLYNREYNSDADKVSVKCSIKDEFDSVNHKIEKTFSVREFDMGHAFYVVSEMRSVIENLLK